MLATAMVALVVGAVVFSELIPHEGPDLASSVWAVVVDGEPHDGARILFLTRLEKSNIGRLPTRSLPGGEWQDVVEYHLVLARATDGDVIERAEVFESSHTHHGADLLGIAGQQVWLFTDELEGRDLDDLGLRFDADDLRDANLSEAENIADESRFYTVHPAAGSVAVTTTDGRRRVFRPPSLAFVADGAPADAPLSPASEAQELKLVRAADVAGATYLLGSDFELASERARHGAPSDARLSLAPAFGSLSSDEPRSLHRVEKTGSGAGPALDHVTPIGTTHYIRGGLVAQPPTTASTATPEASAWVLSQPASLLVWSRSALSPDATWQLARVGVDGDPLWEVDTTLGEARKLLALGGRIVLVGTAPPEPGYNRGGGLVVSIDLATGGLAEIWRDAN